MAKVSISANLTDPQCVLAARSVQQYWQATLTQMGSSGNFTIGHGKNGRQGTPIPTNDIWIAAIVLQHDLALLTGDAHFSSLPHIARA